MTAALTTDNDLGKPPVISQPGRTVLVGADIGNHFTKLIVCVVGADGSLDGGDDGPITICVPSLLATQMHGLSRGGPNTFRVSKGDSAYNQDFKVWSVAPGSGRQQLVVSQTQGCGKPIFSLPLLVAHLWECLLDNDRLYVVASIHDKATYGDKLKKALAGSRTVEFTNGDGITTAKSFVVDVAAVLYESAGALGPPSNSGPRLPRCWILAAVLSWWPQCRAYAYSSLTRLALTSLKVVALRACMIG